MARVQDVSFDAYLRTEAAYLLARVRLGDEELDTIEGLFSRESSAYVQAALGGAVNAKTLRQ